ncbi:uncharacterized protein LOC111411217 [Olea europaea var. sylvestris]|uniref:uncharacterized protein LOC111411217 n=1 Tax=Olea europaea var. sylvestris TaxID=158386 RepID=UPI000C1D67F2|nr:uncharacterized protein LOC111411217 [Olea europaea var. sylvestris]
MKFSTEHGIAMVLGDQMGSRACYLNSLRKSEPRTVNEEDVDMEEAPEKGHPLDELDPRITVSEPNATPMEELETSSVNPEDSSQHKDMGGIDLRISCHRLNINALCAPHREAIYPKWISNPVLVRKPSGKWMVCVDFTNLNKACLKDSFPLPRIDQLVNSTAGHELLSFMDVYSGYNQIPMFRPNEEATSFITDRGLKIMEVYVDDMLVKNLQVNEHVSHLDQTFQILRKYKMKLNALKCTFGMASGQFLGYIVNQREIETNKVKIRALLEMRSPQKPKKESLLLYLAVSNEAVSSVIIREEDEHQFSIYYVSKTLLSVETHYPDTEKLALTLITTSRKLRPYFQAHLVEVLTNFPLKHAIKRQAIADFVAKFAIAPEMEAAMEPTKPPTWNLFVDGSSGETGSGAGIILESLEGHKLNCTVRLGFRVSNNAAEYEALLAGLRLAKEMQIRRLLTSSNSQLMVSQVNRNFVVKDSSMAAYLKLVLDLIPHFERFELIQVPRLKKTYADALSKLASSKDSKLLKIVPIERLSKPSIAGGEELLWIESTLAWMQPIMAYLKDQSLPASRSEARKLRRRTAYFVLQEDVLYKRDFASPLLPCVEGEEATYILKEIHERICENHPGGMALAHKVLRQGYFWPTLKRDACQFVKKCDKCQHFSNIQRQPSQSLSIVTSQFEVFPQRKTIRQQEDARLMQRTGDKEGFLDAS